MSDLSGVIGSLGSGTFTITRTGVGTVSSGRYVPGTTSTLTIQASIQPANGRDLLRLPEGFRTREVIAVFTVTPLQTTTAPNGAPADRIAYNGATFEVQHVEAWTFGNFYRALATKVGQ